MGDLARRLAHVRWIAGGTGAGKSTVARILAARADAVVYDRDRAEHDWLSAAHNGITGSATFHTTCCPLVRPRHSGGGDR
jgi:hypothetical protein